MGELTRTRRWVAVRGSAGQAASAFTRLTLRNPRWWVFLAVVELLAALGFALAIDDRHGVLVRVVWGLVYACVPTVLIGVFALLLAQVLNRRMFARRLREGTVLEAAVGKRALLLRGPWAETTLSFEGIEWTRRTGRWLFLKQVGSPVVGAWPAELFDTADLERLDRAVRRGDRVGSTHTGRVEGVEGA